MIRSSVEDLYVPLWCKSSYSFLEGGSSPEELIEEAKRIGIEAIAVTDRDGVSGMVRAFVKARELKVKLLLGATVTVATPGAALVPSPVGGARLCGLHQHEHEHDEHAAIPRRGRTRRATKKTLRLSGIPDIAAPVGAATSLVLLATDRGGWANLTRLLTAGRRRAEKGSSLVGWDEVCTHAGGVIALWGGEGSLLDSGSDAQVDAVAGQLRAAFGDRLYAMVTRHRRAEDPPLEARLRARAAAHGLPVVAAGEVLYHSRARRPLQDVLTCIRHGVTLTTAGRLLRGNDEHDLKAPYGFNRLWQDDPSAVARTREIAARCNFELGELRYRYPLEKLPDGRSTNQHLRDLTFAGARIRATEAFVPDGRLSAAMTAQLDKELALIEELDYGGYFLTMYELVQFCRARGILCQGRGSAANSSVCYCLGITAIDPVSMDLLFERFLSRERAEPPDIDLDIEHERREEVIQHVYRGYGRDHAAMVCNVIRYRPRSAIRDVGKALGLPETALDRAAKLMSHWGDVEPRALDHALGGEQRASAVEHLARLAAEILDFPRHLSIHPGGFLLGHEPVHDLVPIENATMPGRTVIQWDKDDLEDLGLFKVDLLGLGALHHVHRCFDLIQQHRGITLSMATIPHDDRDTYDLICTADTVGVFQIESRAQMSMLPRLQPRTFYDLVIEVSIVRPGPITGGMVHPYLRRRRGEETVTYPHELLRPVLEKTCGVPLFQEQVMRLAIVAADYTPGEADQLRRDMAAWRRTGRIDQHRERLVTRMAAKGIDPDFAERVFMQIRGFGEYGFPESHACSFALIAYVTSYLRRHFPAEFTCGLLNSLPMGFYSAATIVGDAQRHGVEMRPIDVASSEWDCTIEEGAVRMGLRYVRTLSLGDGEKIARLARERPFESMADFVRRARLDDRAYAALAEAGALACLEGERREALWQVRGWARRQDDSLALEGEEGHVRFPDLNNLDHILWDYRTSDHSTRGHPLAPLRGWMKRQRWPEAREVSKRAEGARVEYVGIVICRQRPYTASGVTFMTLEDETGFVNLVVWSQVFEAHEIIVKSANLLGVSGRIQNSEGVVHLIADRLWIPELPRPIETPPSRDFH